VAISPVSPWPSLPSFLPTPPESMNAVEKATIWIHEAMDVNFPHIGEDYTATGREGDCSRYLVRLGFGGVFFARAATRFSSSVRCLLNINEW
jgi:hypothetical protein